MNMPFLNSQVHRGWQLICPQAHKKKEEVEGKGTLDIVCIGDKETARTITPFRIQAPGVKALIWNTYPVRVAVQTQHGEPHCHPVHARGSRRKGTCQNMNNLSTGRKREMRKESRPEQPLSHTLTKSNDTCTPNDRYAHTVRRRKTRQTDRQFKQIGKKE